MNPTHTPGAGAAASDRVARWQRAIGEALIETHLEPGLGRREQGKVRDIYRRDDGTRVLVATDRFSAFDRVLGAIPYRGQVLNQLSAWWFEQTADIVANHVVAVPHPRATVCREAEALPVEIVVRAHITGVTSTSLWTMYSRGDARPYGLELPPGLTRNAALPSPVITPTTKAAIGEHDAPISEAEVVAGGYCDAALWARVREVALRLFARGQERARRAGLVLVDTKYEMGLIDGELVLIDEIHTPDSSRFWLAEGLEATLAAGEEPAGFSKEFLRRWLVAQGFGGEGAAPELPAELLARAADRYVEVYERLTGAAFVPDRGDVGFALGAAFAGSVRPALVPIVMGSRSDLPHGEKIAAALARWGIRSEIRVASAHKAPTYLLELLAAYERRPERLVYVTIAGRSNALSALVDTQVRDPVIACPPYSDRYGGADIFSSLRMPSGVAPAVVLDPEGAALVAAKIFALDDPALRARIAAHAAAMAAKIRDDDALVVATEA